MHYHQNQFHLSRLRDGAMVIYSSDKPVVKKRSLSARSSFSIPKKARKEEPLKPLTIKEILGYQSNVETKKLIGNFENQLQVNHKNRWKKDKNDIILHPADGIFIESQTKKSKYLSSFVDTYHDILVDTAEESFQNGNQNGIRNKLELRKADKPRILVSSLNMSTIASNREWRSTSLKRRITKSNIRDIDDKKYPHSPREKNPEEFYPSSIRKSLEKGNKGTMGLRNRMMAMTEMSLDEFIDHQKEVVRKNERYFGFKEGYYELFQRFLLTEMGRDYTGAGTYDEEAVAEKFEEFKMLIEKQKNERAKVKQSSDYSVLDPDPLGYLDGETKMHSYSRVSEETPKNKSNFIKKLQKQLERKRRKNMLNNGQRVTRSRLLSSS